jgi:mannose-6-phosphate isomerase-like protein (cupin superfamily)
MKRYEMIEIKFKEEIIAIIIPAEYRANGIQFFTPNNFSQQLAYMNRPAGYSIAPHTHNKVQREVLNTLETLFIKKGRIKVDFYTQEKVFLESREVKTGDVLLLVSGGHGFTMIEPTEMIEVKQGPYAGDQDKVKFEGTR